jgi:protein-disulfide isomerase
MVTFLLGILWGGVGMSQAADSGIRISQGDSPHIEGSSYQKSSIEAGERQVNSEISGMSRASPVPLADLKFLIKGVLEEHPELILNVLKQHEIQVADLVEAGIMKREVEAERKRILAQLSDPLEPLIDKSRPIRGNPAAPITIVEYSDFECPYCAAAHQTIKHVLRRFNGQVRLIYKHNPLEFHPTAEPAARYFEAIALQDHGQAWSFHDLVFEQQDQLEAGESALQAIVASLNIDQQRLQKDLLGDVVTRHIEQDREEAQRFGFDGTPAFLINGVSLLGNHPEKDFIDIIRMVYAENRSAEISSKVSSE